MSSKQSCPTIIYVSIIIWYNRFERKIFSCSLCYSPSMHTIKPQPSIETPQIIGNLKFYFNLVFHVILHIKNTYQVHKVSNKYSRKKRFKIYYSPKSAINYRNIYRYTTSFRISKQDNQLSLIYCTAENERAKQTLQHFSEESLQRYIKGRKNASMSRNLVFRLSYQAPCFEVKHKLFVPLQHATVH